MAIPASMGQPDSRASGLHLICQGFPSDRLTAFVAVDLSCSLRSSRQRLYCSPLAGSGSSSRLSQKRNQSTFSVSEIRR